MGWPVSLAGKNVACRHGVVLLAKAAPSLAARYVSRLDLDEWPSVGCNSDHAANRADVLDEIHVVLCRQHGRNAAALAFDRHEIVSPMRRLVTSAAAHGNPTVGSVVNLTANGGVSAVVSSLARRRKDVIFSASAVDFGVTLARLLREKMVRSAQ